jgi:hypothetical protein
MKIKFNEAIEYDEEITIECGEYEYAEEGINGYPMILVNNQWLDVCSLEDIDCEIK